MSEGIREESSMECNKAAYYIQNESDFTREKYRITFNEDFEVIVEDGVVFAVGKTINLPKTYEDCCKVLGISQHTKLVYDLHDGCEDTVSIGYLELLNSYRKLMICRDAYWKVAGYVHTGIYDKMYGIVQSGSVVRRETFTYSGCMLMFPTEDMCDVFYHNFKGLIINCHDII